MNQYRLTSFGESDYHIAAHRYEDETIRHAASELQKYILQATGAVIPYFSDRCPKRGPEIRVGENVRGITNDLSGLSDEGFIIRGDGEDIVITGKTSRGVLYGVYRFLELYCGFRCFTKDIEKIEHLDELIIDEPDILENPAFAYREAYFRFAFDGGFCSKNRLNSNLGDISKAQGGRVKWYNFHHSFRDLVKPELYFESHPEYFSLNDGKRNPNGQLCLSNPDVVAISKATLREWIRDNPECSIFSIGQNDNHAKCTCDACRAVEAEEGSPAGNTIRFVNELARDIERDYPHIQLHTFAYQYTLPAPKLVKPHLNVIVRVCSISCGFNKPITTLAAENPDGPEQVFVKAMDDWSKICSNIHVWDYAVNFSNYLQPLLHFHTLAENLRYFRDMGVTGVLEQGNFAYGGDASMGDLKSYLIARLLWNPDEDVDALIDEYMDGVFGSAAKSMREYVDFMERACCSERLTIYMPTDAPFITDELLDEADAIFTRAEAAADSEAVLRRVQRERLAIRFLQLARLPMDAKRREARIDEFFRDIKSHGLTEIRERNSLAATRDSMKRGQYAKDRTGAYSLYYIMQ